MSDTPKSTPKRTRKGNAQVTLSQVIVKRAGDKKRETAVTGKETRGYIRGHRAELVKAGWKSLANHEKGNNYDNYPMPASVARKLIER